MKNLKLQFVLGSLAGWINRNQQDGIEYLKTKDQTYRERFNEKRIRFADDQSRRLAEKTKALGCKALDIQE